MIRRLAIVAAWLLVGHAVWLAIFWGLLHVPESSVWMLALSAVLALALVVVGGAVLAGASAAWDLARPPLGGAAGRRAVTCRRRWRPCCRSARSGGSTGVVFDWHTGIAGQIDAWVIARTGRPNARGIHFAIFWLTMTVRWSIGLTLASSLLGIARHASAARPSRARAGSSPRWFRRGGWRSRSGSSCWWRFRGTWWTGAPPG